MTVCVVKIVIEKRLRSVYETTKQQIKDYTRIASKRNRESKIIVTKTLMEHFATNRENYFLKTEIIKLGMVDHYLIGRTRKVYA